MNKIGIYYIILYSQRILVSVKISDEYPGLIIPNPQASLGYYKPLQRLENDKQLCNKNKWSFY